MSDEIDNHINLQHPYLPLEIERMIVEMVAENIRFPLVTYRYSCLEIQLTAHRFRQWTIPFVYRTIRTEDVSYILKRGSQHLFDILDKYGRYTKHMLLQECNISYHPVLNTAQQQYLYGEMIMGILNRCPNIQDLTFWESIYRLRRSHGTPPTLPKLKRLAVFFPDVFDRRILPDKMTSVTHLWIMGIDWTWPRLGRFQNFTHIWFSGLPENWDSSQLVDFVAGRDKGPCPLRVVLLSMENAVDETPEYRQDPRYVFLQRPVHPIRRVSHLLHYHGTLSGKLREHWLPYSNHGQEIWELAERIVYCRKKGYVLPDKKIPCTRLIQPFKYEEGIERGEELSEKGKTWWFEQGRLF